MRGVCVLVLLALLAGTGCVRGGAPTTARVGEPWAEVAHRLQEAGWAPVEVDFHLEPAFIARGGRCQCWQHPGGLYVHFCIETRDGGEVLTGMSPHNEHWIGSHLHLYEIYVE